MNKAYNFRIYPNEEQEILINKTFGCVRLVYNKMLSERKDIYEQYKDNKEELKKYKNPTPAKYKKEFEFLKEVDSLALANAQMNLQTAYSNFFRDVKIGFPKFKSKHKSSKKYTTNNQNGTIRIQDDKIKVPKLGFIKVKQHREIPKDYMIKSCTISKSPSGKYYISILVEFEKIIQPKIIQQENVIGLDFDMKNLYTDNQGIRADYPKFYRKEQEKLSKAQRILSKCKIGSNNRNKQRIKVVILHKKIANQRKDFLHKKSRELVNKYDAIIIEDLNMKSMSQCLHFGKSVADNGWGMFTTFLRYKLEEEGKQLIKVSKWYPSSKTCNDCGNVNKELTMADRNWICNSCGSILDRDYNAAKNIREEGIRILSI